MVFYGFLLLHNDSLSNSFSLSNKSYVHFLHVLQFHCYVFYCSLIFFESFFKGSTCFPHVCGTTTAVILKHHTSQSLYWWVGEPEYKLMASDILLIYFGKVISKEHTHTHTTHTHTHTCMHAHIDICRVQWMVLCKLQLCYFQTTYCNEDKDKRPMGVPFYSRMEWPIGHK